MIASFAVLQQTLSEECMKGLGSAWRCGNFGAHSLHQDEEAKRRRGGYKEACRRKAYQTLYMRKEARQSLKMGLCDNLVWYLTAEIVQSERQHAMLMARLLMCHIAMFRVAVDGCWRAWPRFCPV